MSLHSELIAKLESLTAWDGCRVFTGRAPAKTVLPYALVNRLPAPQPQSTTGAHPHSTVTAFEIIVTHSLQQSAQTLIDAAWTVLVDWTGKLTATGERYVEAAQVEDSPADVLVPPGQGADELLYQSSFSLTLIHRADS